MVTLDDSSPLRVVSFPGSHIKHSAGNWQWNHQHLRDPPWWFYIVFQEASTGKCGLNMWPVLYVGIELPWSTIICHVHEPFVCSYGLCLEVHAVFFISEMIDKPSLNHQLLIINQYGPPASTAIIKNRHQPLSAIIGKRNSPSAILIDQLIIINHHYQEVAIISHY